MVQNHFIRQNTEHLWPPIGIGVYIRPHLVRGYFPICGMVYVEDALSRDASPPLIHRHAADVEGASQFCLAPEYFFYPIESVHGTRYYKIFLFFVNFWLRSAVSSEESTTN